MGFLLQLRILLWKNFTLKKRTPLVLLFELFIPLVLFVVLLAIRKKQPANPIPASHYNAKPLPSAGVLSIMQDFCAGGKRDEHGFRNFPNNSIYQFLESFQEVAENNNFFDPGFSPQQMDHIPELYKSIIDDPAAIHGIFKKVGTFKLDSLFVNETDLAHILESNFSIPANDVRVVFNSRINFTELYDILFGENFDTSKLHRTKRSFPNLPSSLLDFPGLPGGSAISRFIREHPEFTQGLIFKVLEDDPQLLFDPEVQDVVRKILGFQQGRFDLDPREVADVIKKILLSQRGLNHLVCDNDDLTKILIPPKPTDAQALEQTKEILCNMSSGQWKDLSDTLMKYVSTDEIVQKLHLQHVNVTIAQNRVKKFIINLKEFVMFEKNLQKLTELASKLPQDQCDHDIEPTMSPTPENITISYNSTDTMLTHSERVKRSGESPGEANARNQFSGLITIWNTMQKTLCGNPHVIKRSSLPTGKSPSISDLPLTGKQKYDIGILMHVLYNNPKVLYAPNSTMADEIINKANGTFALVDRISEYASKWLNVSGEIRAYLMLNKTEQNLISIREMQEELRSLPGFADMLENPMIKRFIENGTVPDKNFFLGQLDAVDNAACSWLSLLKGINLNVFQSFSTEDDLVNYFLHHAYADNATVVASVVFTNIAEDGSLPPHVIYKIRQNASMTDKTTMVRDKYWHPGPGGSAWSYYEFGFAWVQDVIERAIIDLHAGRDVVEPGSFVHQMPYPCYLHDQFLFMIEHVMPLCLTISWVYTVAMLVQNVVYEKEQRLKEVMRMMGLSNSVHWLAWFLTTFTQMSITMIILAVMLKFGGVLHHSNFWIIVLVLEVFALATIAFSFLVSVCYSKAKVAAACAGIMYFLSYVPYMYVAIREEAAGDNIPAWVKSCVSLFSTTAFGLGAKYFAFYEIEGVGVQWDNIYISPVEDDQYNLLMVILMMVFDILLYGVLTWYIENVHPGSFGLPKPWYFPFTKSYWCGHTRTEAEQCSWRQCFRRGQPLSVMEEDQACALEHDDPEYQGKFEAEPDHLPLGVSIDNLTKVYKNGKLAVNNLSLNLFEGQITSFLGHNGAGKTTTMHILTGMFPPTKGYANIYGHDIRVDMEEIRKSLGMCPQHNVLFDKLTVEEHLWFYARLKGMTASDIRSEMDRMIEDIELPNKRHNNVDCLSGGMKRKLSVAIAFVAGSRTVILDEPTAGVDPYARRAIWDLLIKYKEGRTILLSTHHMDEADLLGDRIAIISNGQMKCCGSSLFLKSTFGEGYHLILVKKPSEEDIQSVDTLSFDESTSTRRSFHTKCNNADITEFVTKYVQSAYLKSETKLELHFILPFEEATKGNFEKLFTALNRQQNDLHVSSYGVMDTDLEEVFLKVTEKALLTEGEENDANDAKDSQNTVRVDMLDTAGTQSEAVPIPPQPAPTDTDLPEGHSMAELLLASHDVELNPMPNIRAHRRNHSDLSGLVIDTPQGPVDPSGMSSPKHLVNRHRRNHSDATAHSLHRRTPSDTSAHTVHTHRRNLSDLTGVPLPPHVTSPSHHVHIPSTAHRRNVSDVSMISVGSKSSWSSDVSLLGNGSPSRTQRTGGYSQIDNQDSTSIRSEEFPKTAEGRGSYVVTGYCLLLQQFLAIIVKRYYYIRRNWRGLFSQILLPALFVCIAMTVALTAPQVKDEPPITLSPAQYFNYTQPKGNFVPYTNNAAGEKPPDWSHDAPSDSIVQSFHLPSGVGATCLLKAPHNSSFDIAILRQINATYRNYHLLEKYFSSSCQSVFVSGLPLGNFVPPAPTAEPVIENKTDLYNTATPTPSAPKYYPNCQCAKDNTGFICDQSGSNPPKFQVVTGEWMQDITGAREEDFYLNTNDMYRLHRYGGFSFGLKRPFIPEDFGKDGPTEFRKLGVRRVSMVWHNHKGFHSMPAYLNTLNNAILRANLPKSKGNPAAYGITAINHPMNQTTNQLSIEKIMQGSDVLIAIFIIVAMSFVPASFVLFLVYEKSIKAKHLQIVSGISRVVYWVANYCWDILNYLVPGLCCIMILRIFNIPAYVSSTNFPAVISLFILYGWSITPMMYPATFWFNEPSTAYICLIVINLFIGITCIITSFLLEMFEKNDKDLAKIHDALKNVFLVFPNYCLGRGLMDIAFNEYKNEYFFKTGQYDAMKSPFEWYLTGRNLVAMGSMGLIFFVITLLCEFNFFIKPRKVSPQSMLPPQDEDPDVANERRRVLRGSGKRDLLRLENLTKVYVTRKLGRHLAVDRVSLGVPEGECFGLLGVNGAGKTTTFKMLTGDFKPTGGNANLNGYSILSDIYQVQQNIGYCPQFDALYDELTAREHLQLYARLRGIPLQEQKGVVDWALQKLSLTQYADRLSGTYSGGNKRKLSTAIALIGHPPVIFLDEPTTGMDPHSRRFLWDLILDLVRGGRSVILTSHSMEECEALCSRLAIMVNGRFKCLGSIQHLKNRFGDGYTISVRVKGPNYEREVHAISRYIERHFPNAKLKESHHNMVQYELATADVCLATVFSKMEEAQRDLQVEDYSISQNTLDNVFINFVKQQQEIVRENEEPESRVFSSVRPVGSINAEFVPLSTSHDESIEDAESDDLPIQIEQAGASLAFIPSTVNV